MTDHTDHPDEYQVENAETIKLYLRSMRFNLRILAILAVLWTLPAIAVLLLGITVGFGALAGALTGR